MKFAVVLHTDDGVRYASPARIAGWPKPRGRRFGRFRPGPVVPKKATMCQMGM